MRTLKINDVERGLNRYEKLLKELPRSEIREHKRWLKSARERVKEIKREA